ncbi:uncharacterized protein LOC136040202 isoform X2 [Artemia franciscana]
MFFSEATAVTIIVRINKMSENQKPLVGANNQFLVELSYRFLSSVDSPIRYGDASGGRKYLGDLLPGSGCSRSLRNCDTKQCVVQSPGYPGLYPRGAHCLYRINHQGGYKDSRLFSIKLSQKSPHKINIKDHDSQTFSTLYGRIYERRLRTWHECNTSQDHVNIYDGYNTNFPLLLRFCGSGPMPDIVSSGSDLLVELKTSMYETLTSNFTSMLNLLEGFELNVDIVLKNSPLAIEGRCEFLITREEGESGTVTSPTRTIPPNTVCQYTFQGNEGDIVWIYFIKYHLGLPREYLRPENDTCRFALRIWNGKTSLLSLFTSGSILGSYCKDRPPPTCERFLAKNSSSPIRPCPLENIFVSSSNILTVTQNIPEVISRSNLDFSIRYHFVNTRQAGERYSTSKACSRVFYSTVRGEVIRHGNFSSPKNRFFYGGGGTRNLSCTYRFQGRPNEKINITVKKLKIGGRNCKNYLERQIQTKFCRFNESLAQITIYEYPWHNVPLEKDCICDTSELPFTYLSQANQVVLKFTVENMKYNESHKDFYFYASYEFIPTEKLCESRSAISGVGGPLTLSCKHDSKSGCNRQRWLLSPRSDKFVYFSVNGYSLNNDVTCPYDKLAVYSGSSGKLQSTICPDEYARNQRMEVYSEFWNSTTYAEVTNALVLECIGRESSSIRVKWLEIAKKPPYIASLPIEPNLNQTDIIYEDIIRNKLKEMKKNNLCSGYCPELKACVDPSVICDGVLHCPSGADERGRNCPYYSVWESSRIYWYLGMGGASLMLLTLMSLCSVHIMRKRKRKQAERNKKLFSKHVEFNLNPYDKKFDIS